MGDRFFDENGRPMKVFVKFLFQDILWDMFFKTKTMINIIVITLQLIIFAICLILRAFFDLDFLTWVPVGSSFLGMFIVILNNIVADKNFNKSRDRLYNVIDNLFHDLK